MEFDKDTVTGTAKQNLIVRVSKNWSRNLSFYRSLVPKASRKDIVRKIEKWFHMSCPKKSSEELVYALLSWLIYLVCHLWSDRSRDLKDFHKTLSNIEKSVGNRNCWYRWSAINIKETWHFLWDVLILKIWRKISKVWLK